MFILMTGMTGMGFLIAAVFFLRFWRRTGDRLFATFAAAFLLLALNQILLGLPMIAREDQSLLYLPRVVAFALLIAAIVLKNVDKTPSSEG
jgi:hypothetical protein